MCGEDVITLRGSASPQPVQQEAQVNESVRAEIEFFLGHPENQLQAMLGGYHKRQLEFVGLLPKRVRPGNMWAQLYEPLLYGKLCVQEDMCAQLASVGSMDEVTLTLHIGDLICSLLWKLPPFMAAALLVKTGITRFCHCGAPVQKTRRFSILSHGAQLYQALSHRLSGLETRDKTDDGIEETLIHLRQQREALYAAIEALYQPEYAELLTTTGVPIPTAQSH
jgi:hypothetical protein